MCFSAEASFVASAFLFGAGAVSLRMVRSSAELPLAAIPLLFALQQAIEGFVWLGFDARAPAAAQAWGQAYTLFSHVLWPAYVPAAAWAAERSQPRKTLLAGVAIAGLFVATLLAWSIAIDPVTPVAEGRHIVYESRQLLGPAAMFLYLAVTTGSLIASSHGFLRIFGVLALAAFALAYIAYARWFISVWCFFAAWLSLVLVLHFARRRAPPLTRINAGARRANHT